MSKHIIIIFLFLFCFIIPSGALPKKQRVVIEKLMTEGSFDKALETIGSTSSRYADDPELLLLKGICYYKIDEYKPQSTGLLEAARSMDKEGRFSADILYHLAQSYMANENYISAIKTFNLLQKQLPEKASELLKEIDNQIDFCSEQLQEHGAPPKNIKPVSAKIRQPITGTPAPATTAQIPAAPQKTSEATTEAATQSQTKYTIQICTMSFPLSDTFFKGQYGIKLIKMGDLYRYIYSQYNSITEAEKDLPKIRKIYPDAFIREYNENKLGKAYDLNLEKIK